MIKNKLLVISVDALNSKDFDYIKELPNFKTFFEGGSYVREVESIYPSLTYCCHTSIITGNYPDKHGIYHNEKANPYDSLLQDWFWYKKDIKSETLFDLATKAKLSTANVLWPVMASAGKAIQYNIPEVWSDHGESSFKIFLKNGSLSLLPLVLAFQSKLKGKQQPYLDNFSEAVLLNLLKRKKPDLTTVHFTELDTARHYHGVFSNDAYRVLNTVDERLGNIFDTLKKAGTYDGTNIVLLGDHGGNDFKQVILLNSLFKQRGLLTTDTQGKITSWSAYANNSGGSAQIHLSDCTNSELYLQVENLLATLLGQDDSPLKAVFTKFQAKELHHNIGDYSFMTEAKDGYIFRNNVTDDVVCNLSAINSPYVCDHGFLPAHNNMKTLFLAKGPAIKQGHLIQHASLVDEGPTLAKLLGLSFESTDGQVLESIFL